MKGDTFNFDGDELTLTQVAERLRMSVQTIRRHHKAGRYTKEQINGFDPKRAQRAGGKRGSRRLKRIVESIVCALEDNKARGR
jgi:hypothetical protein